MQLLDLLIENVKIILNYFIDEKYLDADQYRFWAKWGIPVVNILGALLYLVVFATVGVYLWDQGLAPVFPGIVRPLAKKHAMLARPRLQLLVTLFALMALF